MRAPTRDFTEVLSGLGATGVSLIMVWNTGPRVQVHPFIPTIEVRAEKENARRLVELVVRAASGELDLASPAYADFQITRGLEGVSL